MTPDNCSFVLQLQTLNPGAQIVILQLPASFVTAYDPSSPDPNQQNNLLTAGQYQQYQSYLQAAFASIQAAGVSDVTYFKLPESVGLFPRGCIGHPNPQGNRAAADALTSYIRQLMGW